MRNILRRGASPPTTAAAEYHGSDCVVDTAAAVSFHIVEREKGMRSLYRDANKANVA